MHKRKSLKTNFIFNSMYQMTSVLAPLVTMPYLSRILRAEGIGTYSYAYSVSYYFYLFIRLGLNSYGNRTVAYVRENKSELSKTFSEIYAFQLIIGILLTGVYLLYASLLAPHKLIAIIFALQVLTGCFDFTWLLNGLEEFKLTSIRDIIAKLLTTICIFTFVNGVDDVWKYALIYNAGFFVSSIIVCPTVFRKVFFVKVDIEGVMRHIKPNLVLFLPTVAVSIYKTMDKIMLGTMSTDLELGYYHSVENVIKVPLALITALGTVMLPRMSNLIFKGERKEEIEKVFEQSYHFAAFITSSMCFGIMTVAKEFVPLFFGEGFNKCIVLFYITLPSCIFVGTANVIRTQYLIPQKRDSLFVISLFAGAIINVLLNFALIPKYASIGAAVGTLTAEVMVCMIQTISVYKEIDMTKNIISVLPTIASGLIMYLLLYDHTFKVRNEFFSLLLKVLLGGIVYMTLYLVIHNVNKLFLKRLYS